MKHFIIKLNIFFFVLLLLILIISMGDNIDKRTSNNPNIISLQNKSKFDSLDILFVGNSFCYSGVQPSLLDSINIKSLNLGIATAGVEFYDLIISDYLKHISKKPKTIFLLISPMTFSNTADNFSVYPIHRYLEEPLTNFELAYKLNDYSRLIKFHKKSIKKSYSNIFKSKKDSDIDYYLKDRGFIKKDKKVSDTIIKNDEHLYASLEFEEFNYKRVDDLKKIDKKLKSLNIDIVYFELPTYLLSNYFSGDYMLNYDSVVTEIENKNVFIRVDKDLFDSSNYRNIDHLNTSGSLIATNEIIKAIKSHNIVNSSIN